MTRFPWRHAYELGEPTIDRQHHALLELAELLFAAIRDGRGEAVIQNAFQALSVYTHQHFADEEAYFAAIHSPLLERHRRDHAELVAELTTLAEDEMLGFIDGMPQELERWVENRLVAHMTHADQEAYHAGRHDKAG